MTSVDGLVFEKILGHGVYSAVFLARHPNVTYPLAVKLPRMSGNFVRGQPYTLLEARLLAILNVAPRSPSYPRVALRGRRSHLGRGDATRRVHERGVERRRVHDDRGGGDSRREHGHVLEDDGQRGEQGEEDAIGDSICRRRAEEDVTLLYHSSGDASHLIDRKQPTSRERVVHHSR